MVSVVAQRPPQNSVGGGGEEEGQVEVRRDVEMGVVEEGQGADGDNPENDAEHGDGEISNADAADGYNGPLFNEEVFKSISRECPCCRQDFVIFHSLKTS